VASTCRIWNIPGRSDLLGTACRRSAERCGKANIFRYTCFRLLVQNWLSISRQAVSWNFTNCVGNFYRPENAV